MEKKKFPITGCILLVLVYTILAYFVASCYYTPKIEALEQSLSDAKDTIITLKYENQLDKYRIRQEVLDSITNIKRLQAIQDSVRKAEDAIQDLRDRYPNGMTQRTFTFGG